MAKIVGFFQDHIAYSEGPFVLCSIMGGSHYRLEAEMKGHHTSVFPEDSIYCLAFHEVLYIPANGTRAYSEPVVDWLNEQVRKGRIVLDGLVWVCPEYQGRDLREMMWQSQEQWRNEWLR